MGSRATVGGIEGSDRRVPRWIVAGLTALVVAGCTGGASLPPGPSTVEVSPGAGAEPSASAEPPSPSLSTPIALPEGLEDRTWYTQAPDGSWIAGTLAGSARVSMPAKQLPVAAGAGVVVTAELLSADEKYATRVRIVRVDGGPAPAAFELPGALGLGAFAGPRTVILTGSGESRETGPSVVAVDVETGALTTLITAGPPGVGRVPAVSPSGATVLVSSCVADSCIGDVLMFPGGKVTGQVDIAGIPRLVSDDALKFNNGDATVIGAQDLTSGKVLWTKAADSFDLGYLTSDGTLVQPRVITDDGAQIYEIVLIDLRTGAESMLYSRPTDDKTVVLWPELSNDSIAVLGFGYLFSSDAGQESTVPLTTLDLANGAVSSDAYELSTTETN